MTDRPAFTYYACTRMDDDGHLEAMVACTTFVNVHGPKSLESLGWTAGPAFDSYAAAEAEKARLLDADAGITPEGIV